ncbi:hypothetical protein [Caenimonas koreensis]|uniref:Nucleotide-diphospho-sugar transferase n=1 Tax=Caenimonas koreensis DSM 17982 TaxID=1121255 RepID=A0A844AYQ6_9BURK|nr:hypothetical protein [Caenimonas koreensis]MRD49174.1 hypothetical protein [Caenimonas koreensis DSM 17982]
MKTVVFQSYRTHNVAPWITTCMGTVRSWAQSRGYDYEFVDDSLFDRVPAWFRDKAAGEMCPVTDYARLVVARELMAKGYERTVWVDADMVVFAPQRLTVDVTDSFAYCREVWLGIEADGTAKAWRGVNNSISIFVKGSVYLDFFIDAAERTAQNLDVIPKIAISTRFLSQLHKTLPFKLLKNVGLFSPQVMADIAKGTRVALPAYGSVMTEKLACANLCGSMVGEGKLQRVLVTDSDYEAVVARCLETRGAVVNRFIKESADA